MIEERQREGTCIELLQRPREAPTSPRSVEEEGSDIEELME